MPAILDEIGLIRGSHYNVLRDWLKTTLTDTWYAFLDVSAENNWPHCDRLYRLRPRPAYPSLRDPLALPGLTSDLASNQMAVGLG